MLDFKKRRRQGKLMAYKNGTFISSNDIHFEGVLRDIRKSKAALQPIFEAVTNSFEAIRDRQKDDDFEGKISIRIDANATTTEQPEFYSLEITDNGIGFNEKQFQRFNTYKDFTKGYKNQGSGRIQFVQYFSKSNVESVYVEIGGEKWKRKFSVSKERNYLDHQAIVFHELCERSDSSEIQTKIKFQDLLEKSPSYNDLDHNMLKDSILKKYLPYFCIHKNDLPEITIEYFISGNLVGTATIESSDIPDPISKDEVRIPYSLLSEDGKKIEMSGDKELFVLTSFRISADQLKNNSISLVSKNEVIEKNYINLQCITGLDNIEGFRYQFFVASEYIDSRDTNVRGELMIPSRSDFLKTSDLFINREILLDDIQEHVNEKIVSVFPKILKVHNQHQEEFAALKEMFLLDDPDEKSFGISIGDTEVKVLEKFYESEAKKAAKVDAEIKNSIDRLNNLDTRDDDYQNKLKKEIDQIVKSLPLQNKRSLSHYVARRKLVLELFSKILERKLNVQNPNESNYDEALIHNLLFQKGSDDPENSDLWIVNEEFIYFKGFSEKQLRNAVVDGKPLFKDKFSEEEDKYLNSAGEKRLQKKPDILLFPEDGKCIIIELKSPEVNVAEYLTQIDFYANLIRNYTTDEFQVKRFYGYLIGDNIQARDVQGRVSSFEESSKFDYLYRPSQKVTGFDGRDHGEIYTEVLNYKSLLQRASTRNKIFIDKLKGT